MDTYSGLFYGCHYTSGLTLKKALLLYDEVHFLDRPSFTLNGQFGTVGHKSPYRKLPPELDREDVKIICYEPLGGPVPQALRASIAEDMRDENFVRVFLREFPNHEWFAWLFLQPKGQYSINQDRGTIRLMDPETGEEIKEAISRIDWSTVTFDIERLESIDAPRMFNPNSRESLELTMNWFLCEASYLLNSFMIATIETGSVPFTDIQPYHELLLVKYARAMASGSFGLPKAAKISYLAHTILDEILASDTLRNRSILDVLKFRQRHTEELRAFRRHLAKLQYTIESEPLTPKFDSEVQKLIDLEIFPKATEFRDNLKKSWEDLFGSLVKGVGKSGWTALAMLILRGMPLDKLVTVGAVGAISAWLAEPVVDFIVTRKRINRNNGLAYLMRI